MQFKKREITELIHLYFVISFYKHIQENKSKYNIPRKKDLDLMQYEELIKKILDEIASKKLISSNEMMVELKKTEEVNIKKLLKWNRSNPKKNPKIDVSGIGLWSQNILSLNIDVLDESHSEYFKQYKCTICMKKSSLFEFEDSFYLRSTFIMNYDYMQEIEIEKGIDSILFQKIFTNKTKYSILSPVKFKIDPKLKEAIKSYNSLIKTGIRRLEREIDKAAMTLIRANMGLIKIEDTN
jgi:hypothetical protein